MFPTADCRQVSAGELWELPIVGEKVTEISCAKNDAVGSIKEFERVFVWIEERTVVNTLRVRKESVFLFRKSGTTV